MRSNESGLDPHISFSLVQLTAVSHICAVDINISDLVPVFLNLSDQNKEADCWQEVQKGSFMEVHLGPDPPCGGRDPGLCKLCKSNCKSYCALSDRLYFNS